MCDIFTLNQNTWLSWGVEIHQDNEQVKRQKNATSKDVTPISITDTSGVFHGTQSDYFTSLSSCSCRDFAVRRKPCKHMYRLAYELNIYMIDNICSDLSVLSKKRIQDVLPTIFALSDDMQKLYKDICYSCGNGNKDSIGTILEKSIADSYVKCNLLTPVTDTRKILMHIDMQEVRAIAKSLSQEKLPRTKIGIIDFIINTFPDEKILLPDTVECVELSSDISHLAMTIHKRLCEKFPSENLYYFE